MRIIATEKIQEEEGEVTTVYGVPFDGEISLSIEVPGDVDLTASQEIREYLHGVLRITIEHMKEQAE